MNFARNNHYIPQSYLKNWSGDDEKVRVYSLLVPHEDFPEWQSRSVSSTGSHDDLYTTVTKSGETDQLERWFNVEIEEPASKSMRLALAGERLQPEDWHCLTRLYALQEMRTPSSFSLMLDRWSDKAQAFLDETISKALPEFEKLKAAQTSATPYTLKRGSRFPFALHANINPGESTAELRAELALGREFWQEAVKHVVTDTYKVLLTYKWTILFTPAGFSLPTTDHPSICTVNGKYLHGPDGPGWGSRGAELFLPLSPRHLLYTKVGFRPPPKGTTLSQEDAQRLRHLLLRRAHRYVFSHREDNAVSTIRPRLVDRSMYLSEKESWENLHSVNSALIQSLHFPPDKTWDAAKRRLGPASHTPTCSGT